MKYLQFHQLSPSFVTSESTRESASALLFSVIPRLTTWYVYTHPPIFEQVSGEVRGLKIEYRTI